MKTLIPVLALFCLLASCRENKPITHEADYKAFLHTAPHEKKRERNTAEIRFWQDKLATDTGNFVYKLELGFRLLSRFQLQGRVEDVHSADSLFVNSAAKLRYTNPEIFYSLSQNAITQHRFRDAFEFTKQAEAKGGSPYTNTLLYFDAAMENGLYDLARLKLEQLSDKEGLDYLIRKAKLEDHNGRLDNAIVLMEKAFEKVKQQPGGTAYNWVLSNLADMYGHAGRIEESYQSYLTVLRKDSTNLHCLRGIAWIAYSHDHNTTAAKSILQFISQQTRMPDSHLLLAEIADFENNSTEKEKQLSLFLNEVSRPEYGAMYNKYLLGIYTNETKAYAKALSLAIRENEARATPETFAWLAYARYKNGQTAEAANIIRKQVLQKTAEPGALLMSAEILAGAGVKTTARSLFAGCLESGFELGPVKEKEIRRQLSNL